MSKFYYFIIYSSIQYPDLSAWTDNMYILKQYLNQWCDNPCTVYEYCGSDKSSINDEDVQKFIKSEIGSNVDMCDDDFIRSCDVTPFGLETSNFNKVSPNQFLTTLEQQFQCFDGWSGLYDEIVDSLIMSCIIFKLIAKYIRIPMIDIMLNFIFNIYVKRLVGGITVDLSELIDEDREQFHLPLTNESPSITLSDILSDDYLIMKVLLNNCRNNGPNPDVGPSE